MTGATASNFFPIPTQIRPLNLTMMPSVPVPLSLSTYCQNLLHVINLNHYITSYDPAKQGLVVHYWHVIVTFVCQLRNSRLQRYRRFLKGVPALNDKRSVRGSYRLIRQAGLNDNEID